MIGAAIVFRRSILLVLCLSAGGMCIALVRGDAEPILITRQAVLITADCYRITIEGYNSDLLDVASNRLELKV